jgi:hypothetical protein
VRILTKLFKQAKIAIDSFNESSNL